jgi:hypothetical protein
MAIRPKPTADKRQRATPRPWCWLWWLEVALVTAAVGTEAETKEAESAEGGHEGDEREHTYMIDHMFPLL